MVELQKNEQKTLMSLDKMGGKANIDQIIRTSNLAHAAVMRAALGLSKKEIVQLHEKKQIIALLSGEGAIYAKKGLPERCLVNSVIKLGGKAKIDKAAKDAKLEEHFLPIALGWLRRKGWALIEKERSLKVTNKPDKGTDEEILDRLAAKKEIVVDRLGEEEQEAISTLKKRKLVKMEERTSRTLTLTPKGRKIVKEGIEICETLSQLTPELIITGKWREIELRKFNVTAPGPPIFPGKIHPLQQVIERTREIFLEMGFTEIRGPLVETAFWNFDALFQPQDHPAREMQDTFYVSTPKSGTLPEKTILKAIAETHENGGKTGSKGWGYKWSRKEAKRLVLRTHTTAETIKYLSEHKKPPIKVFSVDRVYRNEQLTYKHAAEFHHVEGIVMDKGVTLRDLMGTLRAFYNRFGLKKVQFWPCYFPYTEPSAQAMVYVPKIKHWIELCGMGMFRPEVLTPLNIKHPVLAWGGGLERIAMLELEIDDIRLLYSNHLHWLRRTPLCL